MKFALITAPRGFYLINTIGLSYHLVLARKVLEGFKYAEFYKERHDKGDFILMDNGAAEEGTLGPEDLVRAANLVGADEIVLPDVICEPQLTIKATTDKALLSVIPPRRRAIVPQGKSFDEWFDNAYFFTRNLDFRTMCVPRYLEKWEGGRPQMLDQIEKAGWAKRYDIHLLGVWGSPFQELARLVKSAPWVRGIDSAVPLALAQGGIVLANKQIEHVSHSWTTAFPRSLAIKNIDTILYLLAGGWQ